MSANTYNRSNKSLAKDLSKIRSGGKAVDHELETEHFAADAVTAFRKTWDDGNPPLNRTDVLALGPLQILRINNVGRKSLREISSALCSLGIIKNEGEWLYSLLK